MVDRIKHWESVYRAKSHRDFSWYQQTPSVSLELIHATGISRDAPIIDVGGGSSLLVDHLLSEGYSKLTVLDISEHALASARERLAESAAKVDWIVADITEYSAPNTFALWHDRAVFHFLTESADRERYVSTLRKALAVGSHLIMAAFAIGGPKSCSGLDVVQYNAENLSEELGDGFSLIEERNERHLTPADKEQQFTYFRYARI